MKTFLLSPFFFLALFFVQPVFAAEDSGGDGAQAILRRLGELEDTVKQLQFRVQMLETASGKTTITSCYMKLPFSQETIVATEPTETGAKQKVLQTCSRKVDPGQCRESLVKCGQ